MTTTCTAKRHTAALAKIRSACKIAGLHSWYDSGDSESVTCVHCSRTVAVCAYLDPAARIPAR